MSSRSRVRMYPYRDQYELHYIDLLIHPSCLLATIPPACSLLRRCHPLLSLARHVFVRLEHLPGSSWTIHWPHRRSDAHTGCRDGLPHLPVDSILEPGGCRIVLDQSARGFRVNNRLVSTIRFSPIRAHLRDSEGSRPGLPFRGQLPNGSGILVTVDDVR